MEPHNPDSIILIRGAGEMATGAAHKLVRCGFGVLLTEIAKPLAIRREVAFAEALYRGIHSVEGIEARAVSSLETAQSEIQKGRIPLLVDPELQVVASLLDRPQTIVIDARMLKASLSAPRGRTLNLIGLGPGFNVPDNARFVIETQRGHQLGRVIEKGSTQADTGVPTEVGGVSNERVLYPTKGGVFHSEKRIGEWVRAGDMIGSVDGQALTAKIGGVLRGLLHDGTPVTTQVKVADIDPRGRVEFCFHISDKARAVAGGVLEAVLRIRNFLD